MNSKTTNIQNKFLEDMRQICHYALGSNISDIEYAKILEALEKIDELLEASS
jgi:hypothetical protein